MNSGQWLAETPPPPRPPPDMKVSISLAFERNPNVSKNDDRALPAVSFVTYKA